ncbi:hypothetical protein BCR44DRAFT_393868 [Catenaria anguillulae PL171]|uniref:Uncharacterized protein n=1 Tax=Catenaria anguillulae PL171 TaxID=765915 RepID=A0A1Y2HIM3_9FUNG|nr:hypothetical protein BCR44DRAFT_393868 [Catenaria anguillulae PL171]
MSVSTGMEPGCNPFWKCINKRRYRVHDRCAQGAPAFSRWARSWLSAWDRIFRFLTGCGSQGRASFLHSCRFIRV